MLSEIMQVFFIKVYALTTEKAKREQTWFGGKRSDGFRNGSSLVVCVSVVI